MQRMLLSHARLLHTQMLLTRARLVPRLMEGALCSHPPPHKFRIRRESERMAEGTLSMARGQPPFPSRDDSRNKTLQQRGRTGGW